MQVLRRDFDLYAAGTDPRLATSFAEAGFRFRPYRMSPLANPFVDARAVWQLVRMFRADRPAIVHTFDTKPGVWGRLAAKLAGVPVVIGTLPGLGSLYSEPSWKGRLIRPVYEHLQTLVSRWVDLTVFQNADDAREMERRGVVPRGRTAIIAGSGVRTDVFTPPRSRDGEAPLRAELGVPEGAMVVAMVSRILRSKGVLEFAASARSVQQVEPGIAFLLVGQADVESLDALSAGELRQVRESVLWAGRRGDVKDILALSDVFVLPSFYREGIPRVLIEAAATGLPLIAVDGPGSREVVEDGVNGVLVPPRDSAAIAEAVLRLAREPELRARLGERSRERAVSRFDLAVVAEETRSLYEALLRAKGWKQSREQARS
jgi:glycosyltransferase involved in cell wall biosynthesis